MICTKYRRTLGNNEKNETAARKSLDIWDSGPYNLSSQEGTVLFSALSSG